MLLLWPVASLMAYFALSPSFAPHALEGMSLPLAILATRGVSKLVASRVVLPALVVLLTLPGMAWWCDFSRDDYEARHQAYELTSSERDALRYVESLPGQVGVLTSGYLGTVVPAFTGNPVWVGHPSWTPDYPRPCTPELSSS